MQNKFGTAVLLCSITAMAIFIDVWIVTCLYNIIAGYRNANDPEPGPLSVLCPLVVVNAPVIIGWSAFAIASRPK